MTGRDVGGPDVGGPDVTDPDVTGPDVTGPEVGGPEVGGPDVTGPDKEEPYYLEARIQRRLAEDPDTAELGVRVAVRDGAVHLTGAVASDQRRGRLVEAARAEAGGLPVRDELRVTGARAPADAEDLR